MPWPPKQRTAIFLSIKRKKGEAAAIRFMHAHGYGKDKKKRKRRGRDHGAEVKALVHELRK